jgi:hypothetical protein
MYLSQYLFSYLSHPTPTPEPTADQLNICPVARGPEKRQNLFLGQSVEAADATLATATPVPKRTVRMTLNATILRLLGLFTGIPF